MYVLIFKSKKKPVQVSSLGYNDLMFMINSVSDEKSIFVTSDFFLYLPYIPDFLIGMNTEK